MDFQHTSRATALRRCRAVANLGALLLLALLCGCTSLRDYVRNGFKVGPNYATPPAPIEADWIDAADPRLRSETVSLATWWSAFNDPALDNLVVDAYQQNLTLREAGFRVLAARAQYGIAIGNFFPQRQDSTGGYQRQAVQGNYSELWNYGFGLAWELDFWGRFRRAIIAAEDNLEATQFNYDAVLVTLLGDVASAYVQIRTIQRRIELLENAIAVQQDVYNFIDVLVREGKRTELDRAQAESDLRQSQAQIAQFKIDLRQAENGLCVLLGRPPINLEPWLNAAPKTGIPIPPDDAAVGIPADLLRRRPDVRQAERNAAAQAEQIGIATTDLYPAFTITGSLGWQNPQLDQLIAPGSFTGAVRPGFQWNLLNYGRLLNNIRLQDAEFNRLVTFYQNTVLQAGAEVENGMITFLEAQRRAALLEESVNAAYRALEVAVRQYEIGAAGSDFNRYAVIVQSLITQQDQWAVAQGQIGQGLIQIYRALGGGWQIRTNPYPDMLRHLPPVEEQPAFGPEEVPKAEEVAPPVAPEVPPPVVPPDVLPDPGTPSPMDQARRLPSTMPELPSRRRKRL